MPVITRGNRSLKSNRTEKAPLEPSRIVLLFYKQATPLESDSHPL
jgi:hypothetical protein